MTTETNTDIPPCPDPIRWQFTIYRVDSHSKTGLRLVDFYVLKFTEEEARIHVQDVEANTGYRVEYRKY